jgi:phosphate transport system permease protein
MTTLQRERINSLFKGIFKFTGLVSILLLGGIFFMLCYNSISFFFKISPIDFFTGSQWDPEVHYSIVPLLVSTSLVALGSMLIAVPLGILTAAFLSEYANPKVKNVLKPIIEQYTETFHIKYL